MEYPETYAGAYVNDDGILTVKMTTSSLNDINSMKKAAKSDHLIFEEAQYSFSYLKEIKDTISDYMDSHPQQGRLPVQGCGINEMENCVDVYVIGHSEENIKMIKNVVDSPAIHFIFVSEEDSEDKTPPARSEKSSDKLDFFKAIPSSSVLRRVTPTFLYSGSQIITEKDSGRTNMSVGYRAKRKINATTYEYGFVTAGHGTKSVGNGKVYNTSGEQIGIVTARLFNALGDFSFVKMNSNVSVYKSILNQSGTVLPTYATPPIGSVIHKCGYRSGVTTAKVLYTSYDGYDSSGVNPRELLVAELDYYLEIQPGDSGGIVYINNNNVNHTVVGTISGDDRISTKHCLMVMKASNIVAYGATYPN